MAILTTLKKRKKKEEEEKNSNGDPKNMQYMLNDTDTMS